MLKLIYGHHCKLATIPLDEDAVQVLNEVLHTNIGWMREYSAISG